MYLHGCRSSSVTLGCGPPIGKLSEIPLKMFEKPDSLLALSVLPLSAARMAAAVLATIMLAVVTVEALGDVSIARVVDI